MLQGEGGVTAYLPRHVAEAPVGLRLARANVSFVCGPLPLQRRVECGWQPGNPIRVRAGQQDDEVSA